jgi:hypothetical protein
MSQQSISLVTNVSANDLPRIKVIFDHWRAVFSGRLSDFSVLVDGSPPTGRIAAQQTSIIGLSHGEKLSRVRAELEAQARLDPRMQIRDVPIGLDRDRINQAWFGRPDIDRCQGGTPISAFAAAFDAGQSRFVLRADCDMLFHDNGWIDAAIDILDSQGADMVEPPRHVADQGQFKVTTRALMINKPAFAATVLPLVPARLDPARAILRQLQGRAPWLALEQTLEANRQSGRLRYKVLPPDLGQWLHVTRNEEAALPIMPTVAKAVLAGNIPPAQNQAGWDFVEAAWLDIDNQTKGAA